MCEHMKWNGERWGMYNNGYWRIGGRYLHREKWELLRGPIPHGHVVHHKNHDRSDNRIGNLCCMPRGKHSRHHAPDSIGTTQARLKAVAARAQNAVTRGKKISAAHAARERQTKICQECGQSMQCFNPYTRWCSQNCRMKAWRNRAS